MTARRLRRLAATTSTALLLALLALAGTAKGASIFFESGTTAGADTPAGEFGFLSPAGLAVHQASGRVYAVDVQYGVVQVLDSSGAYISQLKGEATPAGNFAFNEPTSVAVDNSPGPNNGYVYVADIGNNVVDIFTPAGAYAGQLKGTATPDGKIESPGGVAVDGSGDLYVSDRGDASILKFTPTGVPVQDSDYVSRIQHAEITSPGSLAADAAGNLWIPNFHSNWVKFSDTGAFVESFGGFAREVAINQSTGDVLFDQFGHVLIKNAAGVELTQIQIPSGVSYGVAMNESMKRIYVGDGEAKLLRMYDNIEVPVAFTEDATEVKRTTALLHGTVNDDGAGPATCEFEWGTDTTYGNFAPCAPAGPFNDGADHAVSAELTGLSAEATYHFRLKGTNANGSNHGVDKSFTTKAVIGLTTEPATSVQAHSATLNGSFDPAGEDTEYVFEYGLTDAYGSEAPATPGTVLGTAVGVQPVSTPIAGLTEATEYHYRIRANNVFGTSYGADLTFKTVPDPPQITQFVTDVHSDSAIINATIRPGGGETTYYFEWGTEQCSTAAPGACTRVPVPDGEILSTTVTETVFKFIGGLAPGTTYHYRTIAENVSGTLEAPDRTFTTFPFTEVLEDNCPNAHERQQTSAALLLDCRAYELVSAADTGGYNVVSDLVPGQTPYGGYPWASDPTRVLYSVVEGRIPGTGLPTNYGKDPYVASRGEQAWTTAYVGIPSDGAPASAGPFGSPLAEADESLTAFAFGGAGICDPCYDDGSTNIPLRLPGGGLVPGMDGSLPAGPADSAGTVRRHFSADGSHFIFGSTVRFEPAGKENGSVSIYDRNLITGAVQVVSTLPDGTTMDGPGVAQLDVSEAGDRIVVAQRLSSDAAGNPLWHPYMHVGTSPNTIDLAPAATTGVTYNGMTANGSSVYFTSRDKLVLADTDSSADVYRAAVDGVSSTLSLVSTGSGGTGNTDSCDPVANSAHANWNSNDASSDCGAVPVAGGGGIGREGGGIYFFSPERLDGPGNGTQDAPNLYLARPGAPPQYVATLESSLTGPPFTYGHLLRRTIGPIVGPKSVAVDQSGGDVYVLDGKSSTVQRYDSSGEPKPFTAAAAHVDKNRLTGTPGGPFAFNHFSGRSQVAVDSSGGPTDGYIYVTDAREEAATVAVFDSTGTFKGELPPLGFFGGNCGVAVDDGGNVYIGASAGGIRKYNPVDGNPANNVAEGDISDFGTCDLAVESGGDVYSAIWFTGGTRRYDASSFGGPVSSTMVTNSGSTGVAVDPADDHVFVTKGDRVEHYDSAGTLVASFGAGDLTSASAAAVDPEGQVYVTNPGKRNVSLFGPLQALPDSQTDNPAVVNAVADPETHRFGDFQTSAGANHAALVSSLSLTGFDTNRFVEVYRYDAASEEMDCASCAPTGAQARGDASLPANGLGLSDDGRVFFNSSDELAPRDLNKKLDAYEWADGEVELISTGSSPHDSSLLSITADGTDAFFFTRQRIVDNDDNGDLVRIYDARANGGFPQLPPRTPCQASDECHGPGTVKAPPPGIATFRGTLGNVTPAKRCKRGFVRKNGKCVKKPRRSKKGKRGKRRRER